MEEITLRGDPGRLRGADAVRGVPGRTVAEHGERVALRTRGDATRLTLARLRGARAARSPRGWRGSRVGRGRAGGDPACVNRPELQIVDTAAIHLGAVRSRST